MNERIRKLLHDAGFDPASIERMGVMPNTEKFAELIVKECISIVGKIPNGYKDYRNQIEDAFRDDAIAELRQHFGVEECSEQ